MSNLIRRCVDGIFLIQPSRHQDIAAILFCQLIFWIGMFRHITLPGIYHDGINPEYYVAQTLNPQPIFPGGLMSMSWMPVLGNLYHGVQNYYLGVPIFWLLGMNIVAIRIEQALLGSVIVLLVYSLTQRITENRLLSFFAALALASDIAFLASFRTQFYIILGGEAWLFASLYLLPIKNLPESRHKLLCLVSGICFGLSIYGYFVFLFFLPALFWIVFSLRKASSWLTVKWWIVGLAIGLLTYVLGYLSLFAMFPDLNAAFTWLHKTFFEMNILQSKETLLDKFANALSYVNLALSNGGNDAMIFHQGFEYGWFVKAKLGLMYLALAVGIVLAVTPTKQPISVKDCMGRKLVFLPVSYYVCAALLGNRLWVHHYSVFVPLFYLTTAATINQVLLCIKRSDDNPRHSLTLAGMMLAVLFIGLVFNQQQPFFDRLEATGGVGKSSSALTLLADEALASAGDVVYFLPEWGFYPSFCLLTGNKIPFELTLEADKFQKYRDVKHTLKLLYWNFDDAEKYQTVLKNEGLINPVVQTFYQRDGVPVFYMVQANYPNH